jgi:hypothetical protein
MPGFFEYCNKNTDSITRSEYLTLLSEHQLSKRIPLKVVSSKRIAACSYTRVYRSILCQFAQPARLDVNLFQIKYNATK